MEAAAIGQDCPVPCDRVLYEASLSYAQLSKFNIDSFVLRPKTNRSEMIRQKLVYASETAERIDKTANKSNHQLIDPVMTNLVIGKYILPSS